MTLQVDVNRTGSQENLVSNWEPARSLVEDAVSGARFAPCLLALAVAHLPLAGGGWAGPLPSSSPLVFAESFVLWVGRQCLSLELFTGKFSLSSPLFFPLSLAIPQFGLLSHISSFRLSLRHSGPFFTLSNAPCTSLFSPCLLVVDVSIWATSPLGVAVRHVICGFYLFIFSLPVMLLSEIPKLSTDPPVRGFPGVWELLLFYDSLPRMGLHP